MPQRRSESTAPNREVFSISDFEAPLGIAFSEKDGVPELSADGGPRLRWSKTSGEDESAPLSDFLRQNTNQAFLVALCLLAPGSFSARDRGLLAAIDRRWIVSDAATARDALSAEAKSDIVQSVLQLDDANILHTGAGASLVDKLHMAVLTVFKTADQGQKLVTPVTASLLANKANAAAWRRQMERVAGTIFSAPPEPQQLDPTQLSQGGGMSSAASQSSQSSTAAADPSSPAAMFQMFQLFHQQMLQAQATQPAPIAPLAAPLAVPIAVPHAQGIVVPSAPPVPQAPPAPTVAPVAQSTQAAVVSSHAPPAAVVTPHVPPAAASNETALIKLLAKNMKRRRHESDSSESESGEEGGGGMAGPAKKRRYKEISADNRRLAVVRISGLRGAPVRKVLRAADHLFASHSTEDSYESLVKATEGGGVLEVAADSPSVEAVLGGKTVVHITVEGLAQPLYIERLQSWRVAVSRIQEPPKKEWKSATPRVSASAAGVWGVGGRVCFVPVPPYSPAHPFLSLWGVGERTCGSQGPIWFP